MADYFIAGYLFVKLDRQIESKIDDYVKEALAFCRSFLDSLPNKNVTNVAKQNIPAPGVLRQ